MKVELTAEQAEFLQRLQKEMLTQDSCCQAAPRYWGIVETEIEYGIGKEYADGNNLARDGKVIAMSIEQVILEIQENGKMIKHLQDADEMHVRYIAEPFGHLEVTLSSKNGSEDSWRIDDGEDAAEFLNEVLDTSRYSPVFYREKTHLVRGPIFITKRACEEHLDKYGYNYKNGKPYAMTAIRSPEIERLWDIVESVNWVEKDGDSK